MKRKFDELSFKVSKSVTEKYSTSFSLGILGLKPSIRNAIYAIYAYVRLADEIVDSFHNYNKELLLQRFKTETWNALDEGISINPILQSFQETVNKYNIDKSLIIQFLKSMEMDLKQNEFNPDLYKEYILGSAEVVGLMCLTVFVGGKQEAYDHLKPFAMRLGSAFQKVNFLRDFKEDTQILGRTYFPNIDMLNFDEYNKRMIENDIEKEFKEALIGIRKLPTSSRFGVYLAYKYYLSLFKKIKNTSAEKIMKRRVRIPNGQKLTLAVSCYFKYKIAAL